MDTEIGRLVSRKYNEQKFSVHPDAEEAYLHSKKSNRQYNLDLLAVEAVQKMQAIHPLIAIKSSALHGQEDTGQILFYANWIWLDLIKHHKIQHLRVLEIEESEVEDIAILAWSYVASQELLAINRKENFRELGEILQRITDLAGCNPISQSAKTVNVKTMERLSGEGRGVIRGQQKKNIVEISAIEKFMSENSGKSS